MWSRHLSIALRTLRKRWGYTLIHILGLAAGLAACFLIGRYVVHEWSYDRFHADADDIHRVTQTRRFGTVQELAVTPPPLGPAMKASFPSVEGVVRLVRQSITVAEGGDAFRNQAVVTADSSFLEVFSFPVQRGAPPAEALAAPYAAVLTASAAERYFGAADPVGQPIEVQGRGVPGTYTVRAVVADVPETSHLQFDVVASVATIQEEQPQFFSWGSNMFYTYVQLADGTDPASLEAQFDALVEQNLGEEQVGTIAFALQPLTDIHLYSDLIFDLGGAESGTLIMVLAAIAVLVLVIAGINFVNLSTARAMERAQEVGVRKAMGAGRGSLVGQFLIESLLIAGVAWASAAQCAYRPGLHGSNSCAADGVGRHRGHCCARWARGGELSGPRAVGVPAGRRAAVQGVHGGGRHVAPAGADGRPICRHHRAHRGHHRGVSAVRLHSGERSGL